MKTLRLPAGGKPNQRPAAQHNHRLVKHLSCLAWFVLALFSAHQLPAQFVPGQGFGGFGGGGNAARSRTGTRTYPNNQVGDAVISIDPETRSLIVVADEDTSKYISQVVSNLDRPKPQVLIKVVFLELQHNDSLDIGIEGSYNKGLGNSFVTGFVTNFTVKNDTIVPTSITPVRTSSSFLGSNIFGLTPLVAGSSAGLYQLFAQDYQVTLKAIAQAGKARVLSRPSIVARNNQPATINIGQSVPLITAVRFDTFGNAINTVTYTSVGIILRVTPFITSDGLVEMIISPETSDLVADRSQWVPISSGPGGTVSAPIINSRSADTVLVTPDGQTVIIGGLMENTKADTVTKIPLLGDIPLLGALFRHTVKSTVKTELIIFLTPHIIMAPGEMASLTANERSKSDAAKSLTEQELNKFLDELPVVPMTNAPPAKKKK
jgi:general secretion pathway protein D